MSNWNPRKEWSDLLTETRARETNERLDELFGFGKKKDEKEESSESSEKEQAVAKKGMENMPMRKIETWEELKNLVDIMTGDKETMDSIEQWAAHAGTAVKNVLYWTPAGNVVTALGGAKDFVNGMLNITKMDDSEVEKDPLLDTLQLDEEYIEITDDAKAKEFLQFFSGYIGKKSGPIPETITLSADWNGDGQETTEDLPTTVNSLYQKWLQDSGDGDATVVGASSEHAFTDIDYPDVDSADKVAKAVASKGSEKIGKAIKSFMGSIF